MKTLYWDCGMGAAGDMLAAALFGLLEDPQPALDTLNRAFRGKAAFSLSRDRKGGLDGLHFGVSIGGDTEGAEEHAHHHASLREAEAIIGALELPAPVIRDALKVFHRIAEAEAAVHGQPIENIHFHELGTLDAMADVTAVCYLNYLLAPDRIVASAVHVGSGTVRCAHGELPVPAPATLELLKGIPIYSGEIRGELCTPTGAALLRHFADAFSGIPAMRVEKVGYGTGTREFPRPNVLRALLGEAEAEAETLLELHCNLDDSTPEELGHAMEALFAAGALDVWFTPIGMKKSRPAVLLSCLGREAQREELLKSLFRHTGTLGVREVRCRRTALRRSEYTAETPWGPVRVKRSEGFGAVREKAEYEDLAKIARERNLSLDEVRRTIRDSADHPAGETKFTNCEVTGRCRN